MKLTKEECVFALAGLYSAADGEHDKENKDVLEQLINEYFELIERITPVQGRCITSNDIEYYMIDSHAKHKIIEDMVEFLFEENVVMFEKEKDYSGYRTVHKGKMYIIKPKGENEVKE